MWVCARGWLAYARACSSMGFAGCVARRLAHVGRVSGGALVSPCSLLPRRFVGGLTSDISEADLQDHFYAFGEIAGIRKVDAKACAFITYTTRCAAALLVSSGAVEALQGDGRGGEGFTGRWRGVGGGLAGAS